MVYVKPTLKNLYLQYGSYHYKSTLDNLVYGQALRTNAICTDERDLNRNLDNLQQNLVKRGYSASKVRSKISKAKNVPRDILLHPRTEMKKQRQIVAPFVTICNPRLPPLAQIIKRYFSILQMSDTFRDKLPNPPSVIFRHPLPPT